MKVGWLIDADLFDHYRDQLIAEIEKQGHEVHLVSDPKPGYRWEDEGCSYRDAFPKDMCVVSHGDIELVTRVAREARWRPGAFGTVENFACSSYFTHLGEHLLNSDYIMLPFGELRRCSDFLFSTLGRDETIFVRPDSPLKLFTGQTVSLATFEADYELMSFYEFPIESLVVVSSPKTIVGEWRFVVADQKVIAGSEYRRGETYDPQPADDLAAYELAVAIAQADYQPDPVWVVDICKTDTGSYHLLEIGGFSFADLYSCDKEAVVREVSHVATEIWKSARA